MEQSFPRQVSVVVIAQDEQPRIGNTIRSCQIFADEIVVVDGGSQDGTARVARDLGCEVFVNPWPGYAAQRNYGSEKAKHDWIFFVDADEVVGEELAAELVKWKEARTTECAYEVCRIGDFFDKSMSGEHLVRVYDRRKFRVKDVLIHEGLEPEPGKTGRFEGVLWHYGFRSVTDHVIRFNKYTDLEAQSAYSMGRRFSLLRLLLRPPAKFAQKYFLQGLYKKRLAGLTVAFLWIYYEFLREIKLYEIYWKKSHDIR